MAKGLRSTVKKRNRAKLRANLYGPADEARTERLSAKLQEIISKPAPSKSEDQDMELDFIELSTVSDAAENEPGDAGAMDIEDRSGQPTTGAQKPNGKKQSTKSDRIQKRGKKKGRSSIVFPQHPGKTKRLASKRQKK